MHYIMLFSLQVIEYDIRLFLLCFRTLLIGSRGKQRTSRLQDFKRLQKTSRDFNSRDFKFSRACEKTSEDFIGLR